MMRKNNFFYCLFIYIFFFSTPTYAQNFEETWKEFLDNNQISDMSALIKPDKYSNQLAYAKYLLMNANNTFCQGEVEESENWMAEVNKADPKLYKLVPGYLGKKNDLEAKMKAYHSMDVIWARFLKTKEVEQNELEAIKAAKSSCEKSTLAKYSYMTAYNLFCQGEVSKSKNIFENRTLRLVEKTSLRVEDVEGLAPEVAKMKALYKDMSKLDIAWKSFIKTGVSPGFQIDLPLFPCYPIPKMKEFVLKGAVDLCNTGPEMLEKVKQLQTESGVVPDGELGKKLKELEAGIQQKETNVAMLNEAWEAFIPDNQVRHKGKYSHEYCTKEQLIRAYIMDGFVFVCDLAEESLEQIDALQKSDITPLEEITMIKINELAELNDQYKSNGVKIERLWDSFVANDDTLLEEFESKDEYCDHVHEVKDWTMKGLSLSCKEGLPYLEKIEAVSQTLEFEFYEELECRIQKLRIKIWDCRHQAMQKLAGVEETPEASEAKFNELKEQYQLGERPEACSLNE